MMDFPGIQTFVKMGIFMEKAITPDDTFGYKMAVPSLSCQLLLGGRANATKQFDAINVPAQLRCLGLSALVTACLSRHTAQVRKVECLSRQ